PPASEDVSNYLRRLSSLALIDSPGRSWRWTFCRTRQTLLRIRYSVAMSRASAMIRQAREDAGLTQSVLAERSGVAQSVISSYEKGRREPSASALDVLLTAAGFRLVVEPEPESLHKVRTYSPKLTAKLAELGGRNISVFGSVARGNDRPYSDVDLLIDIDDSVGLFTLMKMRS